MSPAVRPLPDGIKILAGCHDSPDEGMCVMECVAFVAGEPHTDSPECACPIIAAVCRRFNDRLPDDKTRTSMLLELVPDLAGSKSTPEVEWRRVWMLFDFSARTVLPALLEAHGRKEEADRCRKFEEIKDRSSATTARDGLRTIYESLALARALALDLDRARALALDLDRALALALALDLDRDLALAPEWLGLIRRMLAVKPEDEKKAAS